MDKIHILNNSSGEKKGKKDSGWVWCSQRCTDRVEDDVHVPSHQGTTTEATAVQSVSPSQNGFLKWSDSEISYSMLMTKKKHAFFSQKLREIKES